LKITARAHIAVLLTNLFFAANYSFVKLISPSVVGPFALNVLRVGLSLFLFWTVWIFGKTSARIDKKDIGRFVLCGLTGIAINQMLFIKGLTMTSTSHASLLMLVTPIVVTLFAIWVLKEKFTTYKGIGLFLGVGGAVFLILQKESGPNAPHYLLGDLLILINAISYAMYFILVKPLMQKYSPLHVIRWIFTFGFVMTLPIGITETIAINWNAFSTVQLFCLGAVVITGTFLAYYFNGFGLQHLGAGITGTYIYTQPVFAVLIAIFILGESMSWQKILAACLIFSGVYLVGFRKNKE